ncbi:restriction endonuclease [Paucibacter sp. XJ19-41]|uniref:restriction endonuclease n=1 Tax=Paucibacter sp. XJ19-41 TaxID=2927824 RepID=UPI00234A5BEA|nr:restriction endonuclease [Paucibacter sp. XJ19-41]MDC6169199.1 restriction endonuclease [Paucibacter sp. XJ19-41]
MKLKMAKNSLFAILLRSSWWISLLIALVLGLLSAALLPDGLKVVGAMSGLPFVVISVMAARRQWHLPSAARIAQTEQAVMAMNWPSFSALLEQAFVRDGYAVQRGKGEAFDFELTKGGRRMLVCAKRWKSARTGLEVLRALQTARETSEAEDALYIGLAPLSDNARPFAAEQRIAIWQSSELAHALRGLPLTAAR